MTTDDTAPTVQDWTEFLELALAHMAERQDTTLTPGLGRTELDDLERLVGTALPVEMRLMLGQAVPVSTDPTRPLWYDWRAAPELQLDRFVRELREGILFDVRHNDFWAPPWGPAPESVEDREARCAELLATLPRVFPVYAHRGIVVDAPPGHESADGNPVFSFHQTDVIHYGYDLADWFHREFVVPQPSWVTTQPRMVPFWSQLALNEWD